MAKREFYDEVEAVEFRLVKIEQGFCTSQHRRIQWFFLIYVVEFWK